MKVFYRSGIVNEYYTLAKVRECKWSKNFNDWVYKTYPKCYEIIEVLGDVETNYLPNGYSFVSKDDIIGSLPGVHPVYKATEEKIKIFLEIKERIEQERKEKERKEQEEHEKWLKEREEKRKQFTIVKTHRLTLPKGGETGVDGYFDADLQNQEGDIIRMVARNVFDFGYYVYPKRTEGSDQVFEKSSWTEQEKQAAKWLHEFPPFAANIRM